MTKADMLKVIWDYEGFTFVPSHSKKVIEKRYKQIKRDKGETMANKKIGWKKSKYPNVDILIDDFEDVKIQISYHNTNGQPIKFDKNSRDAIKRVVHQVRVLNKIGKIK